MREHKEAIIIGVISVIFLAGMGFLIWRTPTGVKPSGLTPDLQALLVEPNSHMTGKAGAKVTMVEFGDYQCPACGYDYPAVKKVVDQYKSNPDFNFVFRNFPLPQHPNAPIAAEAAEAAGAQGKYWEMHDQLYSHQNDWADAKDPMPLFVTYATAIGLNVDTFKSDVAANTYESAITADQNDGDRIGVNATPTIYINSEQVTSVSADSMSALIDSDLK